MSNMTFSSEARWAGRGVGVELTARQHRWYVDEPRALGGVDEGPNPVELLLGALGSCMTVLAALYAPEHGVELRSFAVSLEGDLDPDGFQGKAPVRPGFQQIRFDFHVESSSPPERVAALLEHIERVCPVRDTLTGVPVVLKRGLGAATTR